jgi:hypothetical protein
LPLQHDHYVPSPSLGLLKIYRSSSPDGGHEWEPDEAVVRFGPEHAWLCDAVAVTREEQPRLFEGRVEDGVLQAGEETLFVWDGYDGAWAYHRYCYERIGSPITLDKVIIGQLTHPWAFPEAYAGQLFEMWEYIDHGHGWALVDPRGDSPDAQRSRARIDEIIAKARRPFVRGRRTTVAEVLAIDRGWCAQGVRKENVPVYFSRFRTDVHPELDCGRYPALVWAMKEWGGDGMADGPTFDELERYEVSLKAAVEANDAAILLMVTYGEGQAQFIIQARDEMATRAAIEALPSGERTKPVEFDNELDPTWNVYFTKLAPPPPSF